MRTPRVQQVYQAIGSKIKAGTEGFTTILTAKLSNQVRNLAGIQLAFPVLLQRFQAASKKVGQEFSRIQWAKAVSLSRSAVSPLVM